jgi:hypothetical protein
MNRLHRHPHEQLGPVPRTRRDEPTAKLTDIAARG